MTNGSLASNRVVDLLLYKAERRQRRLDSSEERPSAKPALATITPFRPLTEAAVKHRERMIKHLTGTQ